MFPRGIQGYQGGPLRAGVLQREPTVVQAQRGQITERARATAEAYREEAHAARDVADAARRHAHAQRKVAEALRQEAEASAASEVELRRSEAASAERDAVGSERLAMMHKRAARFDGVLALAAEVRAKRAQLAGERPGPAK